MACLRVALTPSEPAPASVQIVVDCIRATSTIAQALAGGYAEVVCVAELAEAVAMRGPGVVIGGERRGLRPDGFDLGNSPAEYVAPRAETVVLTTTNGTPSILRAVAEAGVVLAGSLTCLEAVAAAAARCADGGDVAVRCAGVRGGVALDDAYAAGRFVDLLHAALPALALTDGARAAQAVAAAYPDPLAALRASESARELAGTGHEADVDRCARVSCLDVVPVATAVDGRVVSLRALRPVRAGGD